MADDERGRGEQDEPSLELPSLRSPFRRRARRTTSPEPAARPSPGSTAGSTAGPTAEPTAEPTAVLPAPVATEEHEPEPAPEPRPPRRRARRPRPSLRIPRPSLQIPGPVAALVTGLLVGLALVGLTWVGLRTCTALRGTSSCGNPGVLLLIAITVVAVLVGSLLLRLAKVPTHGSTSLLGVGLLVVLVLLAFLPVVDRWWMAVVVPVLGMVTYAFAWWLTTTYVEPGERPR